MKKVVFLLVIGILFTEGAFAYTSWENSPRNFDNSTRNFANSPRNWENSPRNWNNSIRNPNANIIYDNNGNPQGYAVPKSSGTGVNIYSFNGDRQGYFNY